MKKAAFGRLFHWWRACPLVRTNYFPGLIGNHPLIGSGLAGLDDPGTVPHLPSSHPTPTKCEPSDQLARLMAEVILFAVDAVHAARKENLMSRTGPGASASSRTSRHRSAGAFDRAGLRRESAPPRRYSRFERREPFAGLSARIHRHRYRHRLRRTICRRPSCAVPSAGWTS